MHAHARTCTHTHTHMHALLHLFRFEVAVADKLLCQLIAVSVSAAEDLCEDREWLSCHHRRVGETQTLYIVAEGEKEEEGEERGRVKQVPVTSADETWHWLKLVLHIGVSSFITSRPVCV